MSWKFSVLQKGSAIIYLTNKVTCGNVRGVSDQAICSSFPSQMPGATALPLPDRKRFAMPLRNSSATGSCRYRLGLMGRNIFKIMHFVAMPGASCHARGTKTKPNEAIEITSSESARYATFGQNEATAVNSFKIMVLQRKTASFLKIMNGSVFSLFPFQGNTKIGSWNRKLENRNRKNQF
jgi:hypothetical protein